MARVREKYGLTERHACRIVGQPRGTQRYTAIVRADEDALTQAILALAAQYGRYGYRRIAKLLEEAAAIVALGPKLGSNEHFQYCIGYKSYDCQHQMLAGRRQ